MQGAGSLLWRRPNLKGWLQQVKKWFIFNPVPEDEKAVAALTYLRGPAIEWFSPHMDDYDEDMAKNLGSPVTDWDEFQREEINRFFAITNETENAERVIQALRQKSSAADCATIFSTYADRTKWGDSAKRSMFRRGLKKEVLAAMINYGGGMDTLPRLMETAITLDNELYELQVEGKRGTRPLKRTGYQSGGPRYQKTRKQRHWSPAVVDGDPMELDTVAKKTKWKDSTKTTAKDKKCYKRSGRKRSPSNRKGCDWKLDRQRITHLLTG